MAIALPFSSATRHEKLAKPAPLVECSCFALKRDSFQIFCWIFALACAVSPLFSSHDIPLVDLPQHLHLISALHRLGDTSTLFPDYFVRRLELTPYLGYYYVVSALNWIFPLETANRIFLGAVVAGLPLSLAFLLRSLRRSAWPALLAIPFAYGDSFAWGFINFCAALPLGILCCGCCVRAVEDVAKRTKWSFWLAGLLVVVLLFHVQVFAFLALALPLLLLTTQANEERFFKARRGVLLGVIPGVVLFLLWVGLRLGAPTDIAPGQPWKAWGPMLSAENLGYKTLATNLSDIAQIPVDNAGQRQWSEIQFPILAGMTRDPAEHRAIRVSLLLCVASLLAAIFSRAPSNPRGRWLAACRMPWLTVLAFGFFFALPFDIRGYIYYLNTRYLHLAMALLVCCLPMLSATWIRGLAVLAALASFFFAQPLRGAFSQFDSEAGHLSTLEAFSAQKPKVMGLMFNTTSVAMSHPVFLHASCALARARGGITNFSFASTPHSPLLYRQPLPPTFPSEWRPNEMRWQNQGSYYDHFVLRGATPEQVFGNLLQTELYVADQAGDFFLVRKRNP
jgi:hypothetical protein